MHTRIEGNYDDQSIPDRLPDGAFYAAPSSLPNRLYVTLMNLDAREEVNLWPTVKEAEAMIKTLKAAIKTVVEQ